MVDALTQAPPAPGPTAENPTPVVVSTAPVPLDPERLRSAIYRQYGAYPDCSGVSEDRTGALDRLAAEVASSLIQQRERLLDLSEEMVQAVMDEHCPPNRHADEWDMEALSNAVKERFGFEPSVDNQFADREVLVEKLWGELEKIIEAREAEFSLPVFLYFARYFYLEEIDQRWIDHLKAMEALREGIGLRGYGQKDPKQEYKKEGFVIFGEMMGIIGRNVCEKLFHMQLRREDSGAAEVAVPQTQRKKARRTVESGGGAVAQSASAGGNGASAEPEARPVRRHEPKVGRNDPCPCGSGKKYKKCHGAVVAA
jgi:preprotein translocase subunit SecA